MPGQLGNVQRTIQHIKIVEIDAERNLLLVKGGIPGAPGGFVTIMPSIKERGKSNGITYYQTRWRNFSQQITGV